MQTWMLILTGATCLALVLLWLARRRKTPSDAMQAPPQPSPPPAWVRLVRRRPGLLSGGFWGLGMWLAMSLGPQAIRALRGYGFSAYALLFGLLVWSLGGLVFGLTMRLVFTLLLRFKPPEPDPPSAD